MYLKIQGLSSKNTQAISLFRDGKKRMEVALDLDMDSTEFVTWLCRNHHC